MVDHRSSKKGDREKAGFGVDRSELPETQPVVAWGCDAAARKSPEDSATRKHRPNLGDYLRCALARAARLFDPGSTLSP
jgi:hypothetical protein